jgi:hypothetical protein
MSPPERRGVGGTHSKSVFHILLRIAFGIGRRRQSDRPSVTELPGLTSDPVLTADRRGGILTSSDFSVADSGT